MSLITKRHAVSYLRFSSKRQMRGSSIERQQQLMDAFLAANPDVELVDRYEDKGISAHKGEHAEKGDLSRFTRLLEQGAFPTPLLLLVESIDRLSRERVMDAFDRFSAITKQGVTIVFLDMRVEVSRDLMNRDPGRVYEVIGAMMRAHGESQRKSDLVSAAWNIRIKQAYEHGFGVKGYVGPPWCKLDKATNRYVIGDMQTVETVRNIFAWSADGIPDHAIAKRLNEQRAPVFRASLPKGHKRQGWYQPFVSRILMNRQVLGEQRYRDGEVMPGYFPEIVSPELFHRAQKARKVRERKLGFTGPTLSNLFTHIAKCSHCGGNMEMTRNRAPTPDGPNPIKYLMCSNRKRRVLCTDAGPCPATGMINYPNLEEGVLDYLPDVPWNEIVASENPDNPLPALETEIAKLELEIESLKRDVKRASELMMKGEEFEDEYGPILIEKRRALKAASTRVEEASIRRKKVVQEQGDRPGLIRNAIEYRDTMNVLSDAEKFIVRTKLSESLKQMITRMECDTLTKAVRIWIGPTFFLSVTNQIRKKPFVSGQYGDYPVMMPFARIPHHPTAS